MGSEGAHCAAEYLAVEFRTLGLEPAGTEDNYFQIFSIRKGSELGPANALAIAGDTYAVGTDWVPFSFSANSALSGQLIFGGSGLSDPTSPSDRS